MKSRITEDWTFNNMPEDFKLSEVSHLLDISMQTIGRLRESGELIVKSGRVNKKDLLDFIEKHFIVNVPAFSIEENLRAFVKQNKGLPVVLDKESLIYILNEIPESLKGSPDYEKGKINREDFIKYLIDVEDIHDIIDIINYESSFKTVAVTK